MDDIIGNSAVDFSTTDKLSVFLGIRRLTAPALNIICDIGDGTTYNADSLYTQFGGGVSPLTSFTSGSQFSITGGLSTVPFTEVLTQLTNIAGPLNQLRENGSVISTNTNTLGTGNYKNGGLYLCARTSTSYQWNGRIYGAVIRGTSSTATEVANTESWMNGKTKAY